MLQAPRELQSPPIDLRAVRFIPLAGNDQWRARLIDQHAVGLVDDPEVEPAQH
jgi:hypothetical protein